MPPPPSGGRSQIMQGVFLHILADTLGSVGVIISAVLMNQFGWMIADPICSMFIAGLVGISVLPLLRDSVYVLMQRTPREIEPQLAYCYQRVRVGERNQTRGFKAAINLIPLFFLFTFHKN